MARTKARAHIVKPNEHATAALAAGATKMLPEQSGTSFDVTPDTPIEDAEQRLHERCDDIMSAFAKAGPILASFVSPQTFLSAVLEDFVSNYGSIGRIRDVPAHDDALP